jgi:hypothetical protein
VFPFIINQMFNYSQFLVFQPPPRGGQEPHVAQQPQHPQQPQQAHRSRTHPRTLDELPPARELLRQSTNEAVRLLADSLDRIHSGLLCGEMSEETHQSECHRIMEAMQMLNGSEETDDDSNEQSLAALGLSGMNAEANALTSEEYTMIADDLALQLHEVRGIAAFLRRQAAQRELTRHEMDDIASQFAEHIIIEDHERPRAGIFTRFFAYAAIVEGVTTVEQVIADLNLIHPLDMEEIRTLERML